MIQIEEIIQILSDKNYYEYVGDYLKFHVVRSNNKTESYFIQIHMDNFSELKIFNWYKYLNYAFKYNCMVAHIHNIDLLKESIIDLIKFNNLIIIK